MLCFIFLLRKHRSGIKRVCLYLRTGWNHLRTWFRSMIRFNSGSRRNLKNRWEDLYPRKSCCSRLKMRWGRAWIGVVCVSGWNTWECMNTKATNVLVMSVVRSWGSQDFREMVAIHLQMKGSDDTTLPQMGFCVNVSVQSSVFTYNTGEKQKIDTNYLNCHVKSHHSISILYYYYYYYYFLYKYLWELSDNWDKCDITYFNRETYVTQ